MTNVKLAEQFLAECETGCPFPLLVMAFFFGTASAVVGIAGIVPEPASTSLGLLAAYYGVHAIIWTGMSFYMDLR